MSMLIEKQVEETNKELLGVEIARNQDRDFVYQIWENEDQYEIDVVGETYLDCDKQDHVEATYVEGRVDQIGKNKYEWSVQPDIAEETEAQIISYEEGFAPEIEEPSNLNQVAELERMMESAFNDESLSH